MTNHDPLPTRREMADLLLRATALPAAASFFSTWLAAAQTHNHADMISPPLLHDYQPQFFSPEDFHALQAFTEILIPSDDTPGAREAHCAHYIDFLLHASSDTPQTQSAWRKAMAALKDTGFYTAAADKQLALVTEMDASPQHPASFSYRLIKQQTAFAFYTSRQGLIEALDYKGNSYNTIFPGCNHPEHQTV